MRIAVIGRGNIGSTLGRKWVAAGHDVVYGVRSPGGPGTAAVDEAVRGAEAVVLAVPGPAAKEVLAALAHELAGKVVVDTTNNLAGDGALHALDELADGAHPVRAFNTVGWEVFDEPAVGGTQADLLFAAEEGKAREVAEQLIRDVGLRPVWVGGIDAIELVDNLTRLWFALAIRRGLGRHLALKVLAEQPVDAA